MLVRTNDRSLPHASRTLGHCGECEQCEHCDARSRSVCSVIEPANLGQLALHSQRFEVPAGRTFIDEGELARDFFVLTQGHAKLFTLMQDGRRQITGFADSGDFLGLASAETYAFSAEALTPLRLCRFSHAGMSLLKSQFPLLDRRLFEEASQELAHAQARMLLLGRKTARERVASFLMERSTLFNQVLEVLDLPMTRADIADYLGLTIETVSRTLSAFQREGLVAIEHVTRIRLCNRDALAGLAEGRSEIGR